MQKNRQSRPPPFFPLESLLVKTWPFERTSMEAEQVGMQFRQLRNTTYTNTNRRRRYCRRAGKRETGYMGSPKLILVRSNTVAPFVHVLVVVANVSTKQARSATTTNACVTARRTHNCEGEAGQSIGQSALRQERSPKTKVMHAQHFGCFAIVLRARKEHCCGAIVGRRTASRRCLATTT